MLTSTEQDVVKRLSGGIGWPTIVLALGLLIGEVGTVALSAHRVIPWAAGFVINSTINYAWYTVHHDATHKAISGRNQRYRWLDTVFGQLAGVALQLEFRGYAQNHLKHHAHTNTPDDPDLAVKGPLWQMPLKWAALMTLTTVGALPGGRPVVESVLRKVAPTMGNSDRDRADRLRQRRLGQLELSLLLATIPFGAFWPALILWYLPTRVGIGLLMVLFQWLPHFPFERTDRWGATRVTRWPGSTWMMLQQDRHLIHHLYPSIPWFRYRAAFRELRPVLAENHAIIQGIDTTPKVPIQLRAAL